MRQRQLWQCGIDGSGGFGGQQVVVAAVTVVAAVGALAAVEKGGDVEPQNLSVQPVNRAKGSTK